MCHLSGTLLVCVCVCVCVCLGVATDVLMLFTVLTVLIILLMVGGMNYAAFYQGTKTIGSYINGFRLKFNTF